MIKKESYMKKKFLVVFMSTTLVLSGCNVWNKVTGLFNKNKQPEESEVQEKKAESIIKVICPTSLEQNSEVNKDDFSVEVKYSDGSVSIEPVTSVSLDTSAIGDNVQGTVTFAELSAAFTINIYAKEEKNFTGSFIWKSEDQIASSDDGCDFYLTDSNDAGFYVHAKNASSNKIPANSYTVISNSAPLTGISAINCKFEFDSALLNTESVGAALYFSYNYLLLDDILGGYYQDIQTYTGLLSVNGDSISITPDLPALNARYFLLVLQTPTVAINLTEMTIESGTEAPAAVEKGRYIVPETVLNSFAGFEGGAPSFGNGSYTFEDYGNEKLIASLQTKSVFDYLKAAFLSSNFEYVTNMSMFKVYQKQCGDDQYYTYLITSIEFSGFVVFEVEYVGIQNDMKEQTTWPQDKINKCITSDEFKGMITNPNCTGNVSYSVVKSSGQATLNGINVIITNKDNTQTQLKNNALVLQSYLYSFIHNYGFTKEYENGDLSKDISYYSAAVESPDSKYEVSCSIRVDDSGESLFVLSFEEQIFNNFPVESVRTIMDDPSFPILLSVEGEYSYTVYDTSISIKGLGVTHEEILAYLETLKELGIEIQNYEGNDYSYWWGYIRKIGDDGIYSYRVSIYEYSNYMTISFSKNDDFSYSSIDNAIDEYINYHLIPLFTEALGETFQNGSFYEGGNNSVYCFGFGEAEAQIIKDACEYDETLDSYLYYDNSNSYYGALLINIEIYDTYLKLQTLNIEGDIWRLYKSTTATNDFNSLVDKVFRNLIGTKNGAETFYIDSNDLIFVRDRYENAIYAFGKDAEQIMNQYKEILSRNPDIKYSSYSKQYFDTVTGVGASVSFASQSTIPYFKIEFSYGGTFVDYDAYENISNELSLFAHLDMVPSLADAVSPDEKAFVVVYVEENSIELDVSQEAYEGYKNILKNDTEFSGGGSIFNKSDEDGNRLQISFNTYDNHHSIRINYTEGYYKSFSEMQSQIVSEQGDYGSSFLNTFVFPATGSKIYDSYYIDNGRLSLYFLASKFDKSEYIDLLLQNGYVKSVDSSNNDVYCYVNNNIVYVISIYYEYITYEVRNYLGSSYSEIVAKLERANFDVDKLDHFVTIPSMDDSYLFVNYDSKSFEVMIANGSFNLESYRAALLEEGFTYDSENDRYLNGGTIISFGECYGFKTIKFVDERLLYKNLDRICVMAVNNGFDAWRLDGLCLPSQPGELYSLNYCQAESMEWKVDTTKFDFYAYKEELIQAGYVTSNNQRYTKDTLEVYVDSSSISFYDNGPSITSEKFYDGILQKFDFVLSGDITYPEESFGIAVKNYSTYRWDSYFEIDFYSTQKMDHDISTHDVFGDVIVEFFATEDSYFATLHVYDLTKATIGTSVQSACEWCHLYIDTLTGYEQLAKFTLKGPRDYFKCEESEELFATFKTILENNAVLNNIVEFDESEDNVLTFKIDNGVYQSVYKIELISDDIISIMCIG